MPTSTYDSGLTQRGQMTLPKSLRERYHIQEGQQFTIFDLNGNFLISPKRSQVDEICNQLRDQLLESGATLSEMVNELRARREADGRIG